MSYLSVRGEQNTSAEIAKLVELNGLGDPNADRILFWDDSAGSLAYLAIGTNLTITGTTLDASGSSSGTVGPGSVNEIAYFNSTTTVDSLGVATYPSLTEISYVKGVTSAIQTQLGTKASLTSANAFTVGGHTITVADAANVKG